MTSVRFPYSGDTRKTDGFILQAAEPNGARRWFVRRGTGGYYDSGSLYELLRSVCAEIDALPGDWRVETISSPSTIYRDLQGSRGPLDLGGATHGRTDEPAHGDFRPERAQLGRIGRLDLLA